MATTTTVRKTGDALILSGSLSGDAVTDADWTGAVGEIHIVTKVAPPATSTVERSDACTLTPPSGATPARYSYVGAPIAEGKYLYEIQVTFQGLGNPLTWPNNGDKFVLKVIAQLA